MQVRTDNAPSSLSKGRMLLIFFFWLLLLITGLYSPIWIQYSYMKSVYVIGSGLILALFLYAKPKLITLSRDSFHLALKSLKDTKNRDAYIMDTEEWFLRVFIKKRPNLMKFFLILLLLILPSFIAIVYLKIPWILDRFPFMQYNDSNSATQLILTTGGLIIHFLSTFYFFLKNTIVFFGVSNILHHFTFWEYIPENKGTTNLKDVFSRLVVQNIFFFILQISILGSIFIGYILSGMIFIISPINPKIFCGNIQLRNNKWQFYLITVFLIISVIISAILHQFTSFTVIAYLNQVFLTVLFLVTWYNFIHGKSVLPIKFSFDVKTLFELIANRIRMNFQLFIVILSCIPSAAVIINLIFIVVSSGSLLINHYTILICNILFSLTIFTLNHGLRKIRDRTKAIAHRYYQLTPNDKKIEMQYHFWETFASPQMVLFSCPFAFIFLIWAEENTNRIIFTDSFLQLNPLLSIPIYLSFFIMGFSFGMVIWTFWHAVHFSWHSISLAELNKSEEINNNGDLLNLKNLKSQFNAIIGSCLPSLFFFGFGFYIMQSYQISSYIIVFSMVLAFFAFMYMMYMKYIPQELNRKRLCL